MKGEPYLRFMSMIQSYIWPHWLLFVLNRRTQATNAYAAKMLAGYTMQDQLCSMCDMPMMRYKDSVECVVCPKHAEKEKLVPVMNEKEIAADGGTSNMIAIIKPSELQKPVKQVSSSAIFEHILLINIKMLIAYHSITPTI